jgi:ribosome-associated protein YbcJ (S4-like RNA binding protein)
VSRMGEEVMFEEANGGKLIPEVNTRRWRKLRLGEEVMFEEKEYVSLKKRGEG